MKKGLKIVALLFGIIAALLVAAAIAAQSPSVQKKIADRLLKGLEEKLDCEVTFTRLHIDPFKAMVLKDFCLIDKNPYDNGSDEPMDTIFHASWLTASFSINGLLSDNGVCIREAYIKDGDLNLVTEPEEAGRPGGMNLTRIIKKATSDKPKTDKPKSDKDIFSIGKVEIDGFRFRMKNLKSPQESVRGSINWADVDISNIHLKGRKLSFGGGIMSGKADRLSFKEKSGYEVSRMSGSARVGNGQTIIRDLKIKDLWSDISMTKLGFAYENTASWSKFIQEVRLEAKIRKTTLSLESLGYFAKALQGRYMAMDIDGVFEGYVNDFALSSLLFKSHDGLFSGRLDGSLTGLPQVQSMLLDAKLSDFRCDSQSLSTFLHVWAPGLKIDLGKFAKGEKFSFNGRAKGPINRLSVKGDIGSVDAGSLSADLDIRNLLSPGRAINIGGSLRPQNLGLGKIIGVKALGDLSAYSRLNASLEKSGPEVTIDSLGISRIGILGHDYTAISAAGKIHEGTFDGTLSCEDPALQLLYQGTLTLGLKAENARYDFYADVPHADLHAMGLDKREPSLMSFTASSNFQKAGGTDLIGDLSIQDVLLTDENGSHDIGDISIVSRFSDDANRINLTSSFAEGSYIGSKFPTTFVKDLVNATAQRQLPALYKEAAGKYSGNEYELKFILHDSRDILSYFMPGLYVADSTSVELSLDKNGGVAGLLTSARVAFLDKYLKGLSLSVGNSSGELLGEINASELSVSPILTKGNRLQAYAHDNSIGLGFSYDNETALANKGEIFMVGSLERSPGDSLLLHAEMRPSNIYFNDEGWSISEAPIEVKSRSVRVGKLVFSNSDQSITLNGGYSPDQRDTATLNLSNFDIAAINPFIGKGSFGPGGQANGILRLISPTKKGFGMLADVRVNSTEINGRNAGTLRLASLWDEGSRSFLLRATDDVDSLRTLNLRGAYKTEDKTLNISLGLDKFDLGYFAPLASSVVSGLDGSIGGKVFIQGPLSDLGLKSEGLALQNAAFTLDFTQVHYTATGPLHLDSGGVYFDGIRIADRFAQTGSVTGKVVWNHFKDISLDTHISVDRLEVLNIPEGGNPSFYGNVFASGRADLTGPASSIHLDVSATTAKNGEFHIPMGSDGSAKTSDLLTFRQPYEESVTDPYDELMNRLATSGEKKSQGGFGCRLDVRVTPETKAIVEVDKATGNILTGEGSGQIVVNVVPSKDIFSINGIYNISSGTYNFAALDIVKRDFTLQDGSSVKFNGNVMDSDLDITAQYRTKAAIGTLIADSTSTARRTVIAQIGISDKLRNPRLKFSIEIPDLEPTTQAKVLSSLATEDQVQRQFLSLLISNGFMPDEQSGIANNSSMLYSSVTEIMANQLNNILQKLDIPIDMGLDYQQNSAGNDIFDVAVSTQLFNNRVIVNGTIGNRNEATGYGTSSMGSNVVGDIDIEIKLDKPGAVRLNLFSHSADQYTTYLDNSQRNGVGLAYQREFTTLGELWRRIWSGKKWRKEHPESGTAPSQRLKKLRVSPDGSTSLDTASRADTPAMKPTSASAVKPTDAPAMKPTSASAVKPTDAPAMKPTSASAVKPTN